MKEKKVFIIRMRIVKHERIVLGIMGQCVEQKSIMDIFLKREIAFFI